MSQKKNQKNVFLYDQNRLLLEQNCIHKGQNYTGCGQSTRMVGRTLNRLKPHLSNFGSLLEI